MRGRNVRAAPVAMQPSDPRPIRLMPVPHRSRNPYIVLLCESLERAGIEVQRDRHWFLRHALEIPGPPPDFLHIHWPSRKYSHRNRIALAARATWFFGCLAMVKRLGTRVIWTMHNAMPHEPYYRDFQIWARRRMVDAADIILVNFEDAARHLADHFGRTHAVYRVPHGTYRGWYPAECTREEARRRLDLDSRHRVFLVFGDLRPYKNIVQIIDTFKSFDGPDARLIVAGTNDFPGYTREMQAHAAGDPRIRMEIRRVDDAEIQEFFRAADLLVMARSVFSSGTAVLALDFELPIIAPRVNHVREIFPAEAMIALADETQASLLDAFRRADELDFERARRSARQASASLAWDPIGIDLAGVLRRHVS